MAAWLAVLQENQWLVLLQPGEAAARGAEADEHVGDAAKPQLEMLAFDLHSGSWSGPKQAVWGGSLPRGECLPDGVSPQAVSHTYFRDKLLEGSLGPAAEKVARLGEMEARIFLHGDDWVFEAGFGQLQRQRQRAVTLIEEPEGVPARLPAAWLLLEMMMMMMQHL